MRGFWRYVPGEQDAPFAPEISSWNESWLEVFMPKDSKERLNKLARTWKEADDKAYGIICSTLSPAIEMEVINLSTSSLVWDNLRSKYEHASIPIPAVVGLRKALGIHYDNYNNIQQYSSVMSAALDEFDRGLNEGKSFPSRPESTSSCATLASRGTISSPHTWKFDMIGSWKPSISSLRCLSRHLGADVEQSAENPDLSWGKAAWCCRTHFLALNSTR